MDLNRPKYAEFYGDQFSAVQIIFYIAKKSIFINFIENIKNRIFHIFLYIKKGAEWLSLVDGGWLTTHRKRSKSTDKLK